MYIEKANLVLGETKESGKVAADRGEIPEDIREREGFESVAVSRHSGIDLALKSYCDEPGKLDWLLYSQILQPRTRVWSPAHYLAYETGNESALTFALNQVCNGGATGLQLAKQILTSSPDKTVGIFTGDNFSPPGFDRWSSDSGIAYGDAGTFIKASMKSQSSMRVAAITHVSDARFERMHRDEGDDSRLAVDIRSRKRKFTKRTTLSMPETFLANVTNAISSALSETGWESGVRVYLPRLGLSVLNRCYIPAVERCVSNSELMNPGMFTGHLGAGDCAASIADELDSAQPAERVIILSAGAGFTWSCIALERT